MKIIKTFLLLLVFQSVLFSQNGWFQQNSGINNFMNACYFVNDYTGFVLCDGGLIIKTSNGGSNWFTIYNAPNYYMLSAFFIDASTGWAGGYRSAGGTDTNMIIKTTNGGQTWSKTILDTFEIFPDEQIQFLNSQTGYIVCGRLFKTTNGGMNWNLLRYNSSSIYFINPYTGWTGGNYDMNKTTDGGVSWLQQPLIIPNGYFYDIHFLNDANGFAITGMFSHGYLNITTNGGTSWNGYDLYPYRVSSIIFPNNNTGYMLADDYPYSYAAKTTNSGLNWTMYNMNTTRYLSEIFFSSVNTGWAVGESGTILKTTTGGITIGINPVSSEIPTTFSLSQNYPNPFNPATKIRFDIPQAIVRGDRFVKMTVYDLLGREVSVLVNEELNPGEYEVDFDASSAEGGLPSGVYYYKLTAGSYTQTKKIVLLK